MRTPRAAALMLIAGLWLSGPSPAVADDSSQQLAIGINAAARPAGALQCLVSRGPVVPLTALAFSPDGKLLAAGGQGEVLLWDLAEAGLARRIPVAGQVGALAFLPDGKLLIGEGLPHRSGAVRALDPLSGDEAFRFDEPTDLVTSLAFSPDGKLLAAGGAFSTPYVWDLQEKKLAGPLAAHGGSVLDVAFSGDGKLLATAGGDNVVEVCEVGTWEFVARFTENQPVRGVAFHTDGVQVLLAVAGRDEWGLRVRRTDNPRSRRPIGTGGVLPLELVGPSKAGRLYAPCSDHTVKAYDVNGRLVATLSGHRDWVYTVALSADESKLASAGADGTVRLWNAADNRLLASLLQLAPAADKWLIVSAQGYLATSSPAALAWQAEGLATPAEEVTAQLSNLDLVKRALAGDKVDAPAVK